MGFYKLMCKTYTLHITAAAGGRRLLRQQRTRSGPRPRRGHKPRAFTTSSWSEDGDGR